VYSDAAAALSLLCCNKRNRQKLIAENVIGILMQLSAVEDEAIATSVAEAVSALLANKPTVVRFVREGCVPVLVKAMQSGVCTLRMRVCACVQVCECACVTRMWVCMCTRVCVCVHTGFVCVRVCTCVGVHTACVCTCDPVFVCAHVCVRMALAVYVCVCMAVRVYMCVNYLCMCAHVCMGCACMCVNDLCVCV